MALFVELFVGGFYHSWQDEIPTFLVLLFKDENFYWESALSDEGNPVEFGWRLSSTDVWESFARDQLAWPFFADVFRSSARQLKSLVHPPMKESANLGYDLRAEAHLRNFSRFLARQRAAELRERTSSKEETRNVEFPLWVSRRNKLYLDLHFFRWQIEHKRNRVSPAYLQLLELYNTDHVLRWPEGCDLLGFWLLLNAGKSPYEIRVNLAPAFENIRTRARARQMLTSHRRNDLAEVVSDIRIRSQYYHSIAASSNVKEDYVKAECKRRLSLIPLARSATDKGRCFEDAISCLFDFPPDLSFVPNVNLVGEEIDILVKNKIKENWTRHSPHFAIECKNQSQPVQPKVIRNLEGIMRNHRFDINLGFIFSNSGFTHGFYTSLQRMGREEGIKIVPITRQQIDEFLRSSRRLLDWLEERVRSFQ